MDNNKVNLTSKQTNFPKTQTEIDHLISSSIHPLEYLVNLTGKDCLLSLDYGSEKITLIDDVGVPRNFTSLREIAAIVKSMGGNAFRVQLDNFSNLNRTEKTKNIEREFFLKDIQFSDIEIQQATADNWIQIAANQIPWVGDVFDDIADTTDHTYMDLEATLPPEKRELMAKVRLFLISKGAISRQTFIQYLSIYPAWFLNFELSGLRLNGRLINVLSSEKIKNVKDIEILGCDGVSNLPRIGRGSLCKLSESLCDAFIQLHKSVEISEQKIGKSAGEAESMIDSIQKSLKVLTDIQKTVFVKRIGFLTDPLTLAEISKTLSVSRERVRQIENKSKSILQNLNLWFEIIARIQGTIKNTESPVRLADLGKMDPWFSGIDSINFAFGEIASVFFEGKFHVLNIDGVNYITEISKETWQTLIDKGSEAISSLISEKAPEDKCISALNSTLLMVTGEEQNRMQIVYQKEIFKRFFWSMDSGKTHLMGSGKSMDDLVFAILNNSTTSLNMSQLTQKVRAIRDYKNDNNVRAAAQNVGYLFGKSTFGLKKHLQIPDEQMDIIRKNSELILSNGSATRQWHANELILILKRQGIKLPIDFDEHQINIILEDSESMVYLGRMVWGRVESFENDTSERLTLRDAVISILHKNGKPMSNTELRKKVEESRGTSTNFQIYPGGQLIRLEKGVWGLKEWSL